MEGIRSLRTFVPAKDHGSSKRFYADLGFQVAWWERIAAADVVGRYEVRPPRAPMREPWGQDVAHVVDPSGVLWHIAQDATP